MSTQQPGSSIEFREITKQYPGTDVPSVKDVSLTIAPGRFVVLLGPSGCGKTTLLKMVNRIIEPTSGDILIDGESARGIDGPELRRRIGYVIQQTGLFPHMRIEENVAVVPKLLKWDKQRTDQRIDELLDLIGLPPADYRKRYPAQLSGGEQQRVGLARALAVDPSMMLMDEPFGALDAITRARLQGELLRIHEALGQTILFVTHDIDEAVRLADEIIVMRAGEVVQSGAPLDIVTNPANDFVSDLVGGGDALRRLSLIPVSDVVTPFTNTRNGDTPAVSIESNLRTVLETLLHSGQTEAVVEDASGAIAGSVDAEELWAIAANGLQRDRMA